MTHPLHRHAHQSTLDFALLRPLVTYTLDPDPALTCPHETLTHPLDLALIHPTLDLVPAMPHPTFVLAIDLPHPPPQPPQASLVTHTTALTLASDVTTRDSQY